jgi:transposase-like protein
MAVSFTGAHFPQNIMLTGVRWYLAYPLSTRHVEALMLGDQCGKARSGPGALRP